MGSQLSSRTSATPRRRRSLSTLRHQRQNSLPAARMHAQRVFLPPERTCGLPRSLTDPHLSRHRPPRPPPPQRRSLSAQPKPPRPPPPVLPQSRHTSPREKPPRPPPPRVRHSVPAGDLTQALRAELECCFCLELLSVDSVMTECEHYFCRDCLEPWIAENASCPQCRQPVALNELRPLPRLVKNFLIRMLIDSVNRRSAES